MPNDLQKRDLIILGGGAGGLNVASAASQLGMKVTLIEKNAELGGDCLHYGCIPSKAFIYCSKVAATMRDASEFGIRAVAPEVFLDEVNDYVQRVIGRIQTHDDPERFRSYGCEVVFGEASFVSPHEIKVNDQIFWGKRIVIATGSSPAIPPIPGLAQSRYVTNETVFQLKQLPHKLVVLGAGAIGLELAQAFARLGSEVSVIEMFDGILPVADEDVSDRLEEIIKTDGIAFYLSSQVTEVRLQEGVQMVDYKDKNGQYRSIPAECILVATGRKPNIASLNLGAIGIEADGLGIKVDKRLRTKQKHIFAIGDVVSTPYKFTHMAEYHAGIAIANIVFRFPKKVNYRVVPAVIFTDPEVAMIGQTEFQLEQNQVKGYEVLQFNFENVDRALTDCVDYGFVKLIVKKGKILGATIIGPNAGELIGEFALAMQANLNIYQISATIHAYPTLSQINRRVVNTLYGNKLFSESTKRKLKWLWRLLP